MIDRKQIEEGIKICRADIKCCLDKKCKRCNSVLALINFAESVPATIEDWPKKRKCKYCGLVTRESEFKVGESPIDCCPAGIPSDKGFNEANSICEQFVAAKFASGEWIETKKRMNL